jgi:hypothetical protein
MILPTVGMPGRFAEHCENLLCRLAGARGPAPAFFGANSLQELGGNLLTEDRAQAVIVVRHPRSDMTDGLKTSKKPFVIALEEPQSCVAALMADHGASFLDAIRNVASAMGTIQPLMKAPGALILRAEDRTDMTAMAAAIAAHYGLGADSEAIAGAATSLTHDLSSPGGLIAPLPPVQAEPEQSPFECGFSRMLPDLMEGALQPAWTALQEGPQEVHWHRDLFFAADAPDRPLPPVLDVTGLGRCLIYGPYVHLPPGSWSCSLTLGCSHHAVGLTMVAEIFAASVLGRVSFEISEPGFFEIEFACVLPSQDHPVEIRLFNAEAAFEGHLALIQATMKPLKATRIPIKWA